MTETRSKTLDIRFSPTELAAIRDAAEASFIRPTQWVRQAALSKLADVKKERGDGDD